MAIDFETLLAPATGDDRTGPDLAYDPERHLIEQAFEVSVSIDASGVVAAGRDIDWAAIVAAIVHQSDRTKDVWLAVYLCRAGARAKQLATIEVGVAFLAGLLETYWDDAHPRLEEYGFQGRKGACDTLTTFREFILPLQQVPLIDHPRLGRFNGHDFDRFHRNGEAEEGYSLFRAVLAEQGDALGLDETIARLDAIRDGLRRVDDVLVRNAGQDNGTNFKPVYDALAAIRVAANAFAPRSPDAAIMDAVAEDEGVPVEARRVGSASVRGRDDVARVLDLVIDYYRRHEPGSPVPLLLERAKAWVALDFMAILQDISPNSMDDAHKLLRTREPN